MAKSCLPKIAIIALLASVAMPASQNVLAFQPTSLNGTAVCRVGGAPLDLASSLVGGGGISPTRGGACVPSSVRCAFTCQQHAPNCTCFNYYSANGSCEFFGGSNVSVTVQQGCTLWTVGLSSNVFKKRIL